MNKSKTATMTTIGQEGVANADLFLPPLDMQNRFAAFAEVADKSKFALQRTLDELEATYKAILRERLG